jgi:hypothetical protein
MNIDASTALVGSKHVAADDEVVQPTKDVCSCGLLDVIDLGKAKHTSYWSSAVVARSQGQRSHGSW